MSSASAPAKLRPAAIAFGWLVDVGGSTVAGIPILFLFGADPLDPQAVSRVAASTTYLLTTLPVGFLFTAIGGYVGARLAPGEELNNAFVVGIASAVTGLLFAFGAPLPLWYVATSVGLTVPAALMGGYVRARTRA